MAFHSEVMKLLEADARKQLQRLLNSCTKDQQDMFNRMYLEGIEGISFDRLDHALDQVERTLKKNKDK